MANAGIDASNIVVLTPRRPLWWDGEWADDVSAPLNDALSGWRMAQSSGPILVIHGDLPHLKCDDVVALLDVAATAGAAMATDTHGHGINALALADAPAFTFRFGPDSRSTHEASGQLPCIDRPGFARDIDTPADLAAPIESGAYSI